MEPNQYKYMFDAEDRHWWYVGNHEIFIELLKKHQLLKENIKVLDAGCGTGKWLQRLTSQAQVNYTGIDYHPQAVSLAKSRGVNNVMQADLNSYDASHNSLNLITSFDVICSKDVDDKLAVPNFYNWLSEDGNLLLSVPAYRFLLGKHDNVVHQNKRYCKKEVKKLLVENGFEIIKISYCVCLLFPVAVLKRWSDKVFKSKNAEHNEVKMPGKYINKFFLTIMRFEKFLLKHISLPFGLSVIVLAKKSVIEK